MKATHNLDQNIPSVFCWTKMGTEAGQSLEDILGRKELEREAGDGTFCWGIGNSLGVAPQSAIRNARGSPVDVLFTPMKSSPKAIDEKNDDLALWLGYYNESGQVVLLPQHMLVTSRGSDPSGKAKRSHYALFCRNNNPLITSGAEDKYFDASCTSNYLSNNAVGPSQVTAMVKYRHTSSELKKPYRVALHATFHETGFVRLTIPVKLTEDLMVLYRKTCSSTSKKQWNSRLNELRSRALSFIDKNFLDQQHTLFT